MDSESDKTREVTCRELTDFLMDYISGALPDGRARRFQKHLGECSACRTYLTTYQQTRQLIGEEGATETPAKMPEDLVHAILAARKP